MCALATRTYHSNFPSISRTVPRGDQSSARFGFWAYSMNQICTPASGGRVDGRIRYLIRPLVVS